MNFKQSMCNRKEYFLPSMENELIACARSKQAKYRKTNWLQVHS